MIYRRGLTDRDQYQFKCRHKENPHTSIRLYMTSAADVQKPLILPVGEYSNRPMVPWANQPFAAQTSQQPTKPAYCWEERAQGGTT